MFENNSESYLKNGIQLQIAILFSVLICLKNGKFATLVFEVFTSKSENKSVCVRRFLRCTY